MRRVLIAALFVFCAIPKANAWGNRGHQLVAYIAYMNLDPKVRLKVDALVQLNPCINEWNATVASLAAAQRPVALFMLAANWPDRIKLSPPYGNYTCQPQLTFSNTDGAPLPNGGVNSDVAPNTPDASRNIGYDDDRRHKYWHFVDTPLAANDTPVQPASSVNALTELQLLTQALASGEDKQLASYDLVWLEHLAGDIHQPLHDAQRFSSTFPNGDQGGNAVHICSGDHECRNELHSYWDDLPGSDASISATIKLGATLNKQAAPSDAVLDIGHPEHWVSDAFTMAKQDAYTAPFTPDQSLIDPSSISDDYHSKAMADMRQQVFIAGYRLKALLNSSLKS